MWYPANNFHFDAVVFDHNSGKRAVLPKCTGERGSTEISDLHLQTQGKFTNQATMSLYCKVCGHVMNGDMEARMHAGDSGHTEFASISIFYI